MKNEKVIRGVIKKFTNSIIEHYEKYGQIGSLGVMLMPDRQLICFNPTNGKMHVGRIITKTKNKHHFTFALIDVKNYGYKVLWIDNNIYHTNSPVFSYKQNINQSGKDLYAAIMEYLDN